jgi:iron(III) transport system ATP-binding protein
VIEISHAKVKLQGKTILSDVSLSLKAGEILGLVGPSGCGKTTLLNTIAGFIEQSEGDIVIDNAAVINPKNKVPSEKRNVGMIFQDYALFPHLSVNKNVAFGLGKLTKRDKAKRVIELLSLLKLESLGERYPHQLSGGQQQRVAIARALAPQPKVLLLDEPFSNIDARLRHELMIEIRDLLKALNMSAIFVTHNKDEVFTFADKIAVMNNGEILQVGSPIQVSQQPNCWQVADFLQLGSWIPLKIDNDNLATLLGNILISEISNRALITKSMDDPVLLVKPQHILVNSAEKPNVVVHHIGITEYGYHYVLKSLVKDSRLSFSQLNFYSNDLFQLGQQLSCSIIPHSCLVFDPNMVNLK